MDCWGNGVLRRFSEALDRRGTQVSAPEADSVAGSVERGISPRGTSDFEKVKVFHGTSLEPGRKLGRGCGQECTLFGCKLNFPHERTWHPEVCYLGILCGVLVRPCLGGGGKQRQVLRPEQWLDPNVTFLNL